jgi:hypothetical protein
MSIMARGKAQGNGETFLFTVEEFVTGGFRLDIDFSGAERDGGTGAGIWPSVEKAKAIAEETAKRLLGGASVTWE